MYKKKIPATFLLAAFLLNACTVLKYSKDPNYSLCKQLEGQIQFGDNTSYLPEAQSAHADKRRLQATYHKLNCSKYQLLKF